MEYGIPVITRPFFWLPGNPGPIPVSVTVQILTVSAEICDAGQETQCPDWAAGDPGAYNFEVSNHCEFVDGSRLVKDQVLYPVPSMIREARKYKP